MIWGEIMISPPKFFECQSLVLLCILKIVPHPHQILPIYLASGGEIEIHVCSLSTDQQAGESASTVPPPGSHDNTREW